MKDSPLAKTAEVVRKIASIWNEMSEKQKSPYRGLARKGIAAIILIMIEKERYDNEMKKLKEISGDLIVPKKSLSAYMIFVKEVSFRIFTFPRHARCWPTCIQTFKLMFSCRRLGNYGNHSQPKKGKLSKTRQSKTRSDS